MKRLRFYSTNWEIPFSELGTRLKRRPFTRDASSGFLLDRVRDDKVEAKYIEKTELSEVIVDPFGAQQEFMRIDYKYVYFSLFPSFPNLEVYNPPRGLSGFFSRLGEVCDFSVSISSIDVDVLEWIRVLEERMGKHAQVKSLRIKGLRLGETTSAQVLLDGSKDVRPDIPHVAGGKGFRSDKLKALFSTDTTASPVYLGANASAASSHETIVNSLPLLRTSLAEASRRDT